MDKLWSWAWALVPVGLIGVALAGLVFDPDTYLRDLFLNVGSVLLLTAPIKLAERDLEKWLGREVTRRAAIEKARQLMEEEDRKGSYWGDCSVAVIEEALERKGWSEEGEDDGMSIWSSKGGRFVAYPTAGHRSPGRLTTGLVTDIGIKINVSKEYLEKIENDLTEKGRQTGTRAIDAPQGQAALSAPPTSTASKNESRLSRLRRKLKFGFFGRK